ncbi:hypothetical protein HPB48_000187 [Haemaphysalis longicornis]|uniref:Uncharacterized protein n=1 Tax=Haemaphysalis longicornis TaxID=44386 RepID=A0A9J6GU25_HAELO|nr:hypothetical protein HPB48_000187 [Haemaphysalis longicornis]
MLEKDGLYSLEGASFVTAKISQATLPFLDKRWQNQRKPDAPRSETPLVQQAPTNRSVEPMSASATTLHPAPPRSLAQRTPLLQFSQPTLQPQEGVPWTPAMGTLPEPVQTLQAPPLPRLYGPPRWIGATLPRALVFPQTPDGSGDELDASESGGEAGHIPTQNSAATAPKQRPTQWWTIVRQA